MEGSAATLLSLSTSSSLAEMQENAGNLSDAGHGLPGIILPRDPPRLICPGGFLAGGLHNRIRPRMGIHSYNPKTLHLCYLVSNRKYLIGQVPLQ